MIRVLLADDHAIVRAGLRSLLEGMGGVTVVAEADNGREALVLARQHKPDLLMLDISMKPLNGIDATVQLRREMPEARVLILSMHSTPEFVIRAIQAGARGYLVKDSAPAELPIAVGAVMREDFYLSPRISRHVVDEMLQAAPMTASRATIDLSSPPAPRIEEPVPRIEEPVPRIEEPAPQPPSQGMPRWILYVCIAIVVLAAALGSWRIVGAIS